MNVVIITFHPKQQRGLESEPGRRFVISENQTVNTKSSTGPTHMTLEFKKCFEPRLVSLGPLHHGDPKFQSAEVSKLQFAAFFALENRTTDNSLFENQIHYGVLQILIESANDPQKWKKSLKGFIAQNLVTNIPGEHKRSTVKVPDREDYAHLLEWLRAEHLVGDEVKRESSTIGNMLLYCADSQRHGKTFHSIKELRESGIHVKPTQTINLKNIYFYCKFLGKLMMPHLLVDDSTVSKFLNLVALETCRDFRNEFEITTYLCFLNSLINTADDVKELSGTLMWITTYLCFLNSLIDTADDVKEQRVTVMLHNYLGSDEEVADLFNKMSRDLVPDQQWYSDVVKDIHKCCNNPWTAALAYAYYTHFSSSWSILAFLGAIIGLLFSATQAYFSLPQNRH
ncbi:Tetratricopeptide repeat (TPR)-like superfamily protein [Hibiscus syriacus]|uniref:Tetratricopeptide repeat (TPR)-like superfamily protein n=1 Tax=Hibiscus syriacus TaxID=106335 RepID=A0A6A2YME2_HIBSY|nr:Tetratricopeptide repeat (TPR)-like superfamily protein [Hibiscus syriacus]